MLFCAGWRGWVVDFVWAFSGISRLGCLGCAVCKLSERQFSQACESQVEMIGIRRIADFNEPESKCKLPLVVTI